MRYMAALLALVVVVPLVGTGCQTISEHQRTAIGAGTGAAGGALAGGLIGGDATGVVVGGLIGALAGGGVGYYLDHQNRTRTQAVEETGYSPAQGNLVRVDGVQASPAQLRPGDTVNLTTTYTVLTPQANQSNLIRETREIRHDGVLVANPATEVSRPNGTFTSTLPIVIPATAPRGAYEVTTTIASGDRLSRAATRFTVN